MTLHLKVPKLACSACVNKVIKAVKSVDGNATVEADTKTKMVKIQTESPEAQIKQIIASAGYPAA